MGSRLSCIVGFREVVVFLVVWFFFGKYFQHIWATCTFVGTILPLTRSFCHVLVVVIIIMFQNFGML